MRAEVTVVVNAVDRDAMVDGLVALSETEGVELEQCRVGGISMTPEEIAAHGERRLAEWIDNVDEAGEGEGDPEGDEDPRAGDAPPVGDNHATEGDGA